MIEAQKTVDGRHLFKVADISQMLIVSDPIKDESRITESALNADDYIWPHGITPPMKHVRKRRFRKRLSRQTIEVVEEQVEELIRKDEEADSMTFGECAGAGLRTDKQISSTHTPTPTFQTLTMSTGRQTTSTDGTTTTGVPSLASQRRTTTPGRSRGPRVGTTTARASTARKARRVTTSTAKVAKAATTSTRTCRPR